jgi:hypothetical protein
VLIRPKVFDGSKAQLLVKAMSIVVEDKDHVTERLAPAFGLVNQPAQEERAGAAVLKLRQQGYVEQANLF